MGSRKVDVRSSRSKRIAVVVTTISRGHFVNEYVEAAKAQACSDEISIYVIGDVNTPPECQQHVRMARAEGLVVNYIDMQQQTDFLKPFSKLADRIPVRSDQRRNIGYLLALQDRCDVLISIDDDNFPKPESPFFEQHRLAGERQTLPATKSRNGWFNVGSLLESTTMAGDKCRIYPRGFPHCRRFEDESSVQCAPEVGTIGVNVGLWTGDPDVDAATRLVTGCRTKEKADFQGCMLGRGQRMPINSQNTALVWHAIPAYYFVLMHRDVVGMQIDRFADIFSGYFLQMCAEAVGQRVRVGGPYVFQKRNQHNVLQDLRAELPGMILIEEMVGFLEESLGRAGSYAEAYLCLSERLLLWSQKQQGGVWTASTRRFLHEVSDAMRNWVEACVALAGGEKALRS